MEMHILERIKPVCWPCSIHRPQCWGEIAVQQKHIYAICQSLNIQICSEHSAIKQLCCLFFTLASAFFRFLNNVLDLEFLQVNAVIFFPPLALFLGCVVGEFS